MNLTKDQKLSRFLRKLAHDAVTKDDIETNLSHSVHIVERELKVHIGLDYPLIKFWNQYDEIKWYKEEEKKKYDEQDSIRTMGS